MVEMSWNINQPGRWRRPGLVADIPVSYTHLRAHETVLDLVCRLLLEKQNTLNHYLTKNTTQ